jgi:hypothetical protein
MNNNISEKEAPTGKVVSSNKCKSIDVLVDSENVATMTLFELARWNCLLEAVDIIDSRIDEIEFKTKRRANWVKPIAIQKYVDDRTDSMLHELAVEHNIESVFVSPPCTTS